MIDFKNIMSGLGVDTEDITKMFAFCSELIEETRAFALEFGYEKDAKALSPVYDKEYPDSLDFKFGKEVNQRLMNTLRNGNTDVAAVAPKVAQDAPHQRATGNTYGTGDLTYPIIWSCYDATVERLNGTDLFYENHLHLEENSSKFILTHHGDDNIIDKELDLGGVSALYDKGKECAEAVCDTLDRIIQDRRMNERATSKTTVERE